MDIRLITNTENTWGLSKDTEIIGHLLEKHGHRISVQHWAKAPRSPQKVHLNIHIELVGGRHFRNALRNVLIPNPEWFMDDWLNQARLRFNRVFCKTARSEAIFRKLGFGDRVYRTGFTSVDRYQPSSSKTRSFVHIAGNSVLKNTQAVVTAWLAHPEWPPLHVYASNPSLDFRPQIKTAANITQFFGHVSEAEIVAAQNQHMFAIQPSASEGFGHCIVEPLSAGAIVITADAPPMNEFQPVLKTPVKATGYHWHDITYTPTAIADTLNHVLAMSDTQLGFLAQAGRKWWLANNQQFETLFLKGLPNV